MLDLLAEPLFGDEGVLDDLTGDLPFGGAVPGQADATKRAAIDKARYQLQASHRMISHEYQAMN